MANASNVSVAKAKVGGAISVAPKGTSIPEDALEELSNVFKSLGYCGNEGLVNSNSPSTGSSIAAWGGDVVINPQAEKPDTFNYNLIESLNVEVLKYVYGSDNVIGSSIETGIKIKANAKELPEHVLVCDMVLKDGILKRIVIPKATITAIADITYKDDTIVGYNVTISAAPDELGNSHYEYMIADPTTPTF